mmetsp:Transcript_170305/g.540842  ORF Transcript_170305/g.540842 Transcript_170305/m.540842 type:complete len:290 (+) Transcript_170305:94-963(+)
MATRMICGRGCKRGAAHDSTIFGHDFFSPFDSSLASMSNDKHRSKTTKPRTEWRECRRSSRMRPETWVRGPTICVHQNPPRIHARSFPCSIPGTSALPPDAAPGTIACARSQIVGMPIATVVATTGRDIRDQIVDQVHATATATATALGAPLALLGRRLCLDRLDHLVRLDRLGLGLLQQGVQILGAVDEGQRELKATTDWICTAGELLDCRISDSPAAFALCIGGSLLRSERRGRGLDHASDHPLSSFRRRTPLPGRLVDLEHRGQECEVLAQKNPAQCLQCSASSWP